MSNLSILDHNVLAGLSEPAHGYYLRLRDRLGPLSAERAAWEWETVLTFLNLAIPIAMKGYGSKADNVRLSLIEFFETRMLNKHLAQVIGVQS